MESYIDYIFSKEIGQQLNILEILYSNTDGIDTATLTELTKMENCS